MTIEDFDYRRNLNDRFLIDILDENKIVLTDKIGVFASSDKTIDSTTTDEPVKVDVVTSELEAEK
jgi:hypothetical protein